MGGLNHEIPGILESNALPGLVHGRSADGDPPKAMIMTTSTDVHAGRILVLDFGSQYTRLIARRIREAGVYSEIRGYDAGEEAVAAFAPRGIVLSGGPDSVAAGEDSLRIPEAVFAAGVPVLGLCYGMQAMAARFGGAVEAAPAREFGMAEVRARGRSELLRGIGDRTGPAGEGLLDVWMSHGDRVSALPEGFRTIASSPNAPIAGIADEARRLYGLQFHPEVAHTRQGAAILARFVNRICGCPPVWTPANIVEDRVAAIRRQVGTEGTVLLALSGGVDSAVTAALIHRALGGRVSGIFVDNGLLRRGEGDRVMEALAFERGIAVRRIDAGARFLAALEGIEDPEEKRRIIGNLFIEIFEEEASRAGGGASFLAQGTIYPDVIESARADTGGADVIKSHHNVGGLPERMRLRLVEPLRELFKDEVRAVGLELGLARELVYRHPFPGPGLAVRVLGEVREDRVERLRAADAIFLEELHRAGWYGRVAQAFAVLLPVRSVGVMGDQRSHEPVVVLRAVETDDFMTARAARLPWALMETVATRIVNEVPGISRVGVDVTSKPPATIEWE